MMTESELAELRALQRRAYGREGSLTAADAARLQELETSGVRGEAASDASARGESAPRAAEISSMGGDLTPDAPPIEANSAREGAAFGRSGRDRGADAGPTEAAGDAESAGAAPEDAAVGTPTSWRKTLRRSWRLVAAASALLLAIGIGAGWMLFAPKSDDIPLSADEVQRRTELYDEGRYVDGSIRAVARDGDALVWYATRSDGGDDTSCIILDVGGLSQTGCAPSEALEVLGGLSATVFVEESDGDETVIGGGTLAGGVQISAYATTSTTGDVLVAIQRWDITDSMLDQYEGEERTRAEALVAEGYQPDLTLIGYFREKPVWLADRFDDGGDMQRCLIADAVSEWFGCVAFDGSISDGDAITTRSPEGDWALEVRYVGWGTPYLTITEVAESSGLGVFDTETGDQIDVEAPKTEP